MVKIGSIAILDRDGTLPKNPFGIFSHLLDLGIYPVVTTGRPLSLALSGYDLKTLGLLAEGSPFGGIPCIALNGAIIGWFNPAGEVLESSIMMTVGNDLIGKAIEIAMLKAAGVEGVVITRAEGIEILCFSQVYYDAVLSKQFKGITRLSAVQELSTALQGDIGSIILIVGTEAVRNVIPVVESRDLAYELGQFPLGRITIDLLPDGVSKASAVQSFAGENALGITLLAGDSVETKIAGYTYKGNDLCLFEMEGIPVKILVGGAKSDLATYETDSPENLLKVIQGLNL